MRYNIIQQIIHRRYNIIQTIPTAVMSEILRQTIPPQYYKQHFSSISFKTSFGNCVYLALKKRKWKQYIVNDTEKQSNQSNSVSQWTLQWCEKQRVNDVFEEGISANQRVNHFRLYTQLCRKDMLMKNVRRYKQELKKKKELIQNEWNFLPATYFLPSEYIMFVEDFKKSGGLWILKPTGRCQGSGIFIVDKLSQVAPYKNKATQNQNTQANQKMPNKKVIKEIPKQQGSESETENIEEAEENANTNQTFLIQKYLDQPLLFGKKKFDMRLYVLCTDYQNLTVWLYRSGFARFTHEPYSTEDINNLGGHLTNVEIQKHCDNYDTVRGGKWLLNQFKLYLFTRYSKQKVNQCFMMIKQIILNSLKAVQSKLIPSKSSFQLYGYDFMLSSDLKPWLIEVNGGPSMTANTQFDCKLKCGLVDDVLSVLDLEGYLKGDEMTVGGFDLIMKKGIKVSEPKQSEYGSLLGCYNERKKVMKNIGRRLLMSKKTLEQKQNQLRQKRKEEKEKKMEKANAQKQRLLPSFYYQRKQGEANLKAILELKEELQLLGRNKEDEEQITETNFSPLRAVVSQ